MVEAKVGMFKLEAGSTTHIACAVAMSPNKQHAKKHRQSGPVDILLGVFYEFKRSNDSRK